MSATTDLQQSILDAMQLLSNNSVQNTNATITVKSQIVEIVDAGLKLYKVQYGANTFNAYAASDTNYNVGDIVYVLVPDGDFSSQKIILGYTAPSATIYDTSQEGDYYIQIGDSLISTYEIKLKSSKDEVRNISFDYNNMTHLLNEYLTHYRNFTLSARIKTTIPANYQSKGNYGFTLTIPFVEKETKNLTTRSYTMDVSNIQGNPYNLTEYQLCNLYYTIDDNLEYDPARPTTLTAFVDGFGYVQELDDYDIFIKDIGFNMIQAMTEAEQNGYYLAISPEKGNYYLSNDSDYKAKTLTPILKINGKNSSLNSWECYWFEQDASVDLSSENYCNIGGVGWKCLNSKTNVSTDETGYKSFQWVTNNYIYTVYNNDIRGTKIFKCVLVKDETVVSGQTYITNLKDKLEFQLVSATGSTSFVEGIGNVDLIARINYLPAANESITTKWQRFDKDDRYLDNDFYTIEANNRVNGDWLETEIKYPCSILEQLNRVVCTFYCTTTKNETTDNNTVVTTTKKLLGSAEIVVSTKSDFIYTLSVSGGSVLYKYDADGDSPLVANYDGPASSKVTTIKPLSYRMFKADGSELTDDEYKQCKYTWAFPINSMMKLEGKSPTNEDDNYYYITNTGKENSDLNYTILSRYNKKKTNNTIILTVEFDGNVLSQDVSPQFLKDGMGGTNGTKYSAVITYNNRAYGERNANGIPQKLQFVKVTDTNNWYYRGEGGELVEFTDPISLGLEVYRDGEKINTGFTTTWSMFDNSNLISNVSFAVGFDGKLSLSNRQSPTPINIVQVLVTANDVAGATDSRDSVYAYYPIEVTIIDRLPSDIGIAIPSLDGGFEEAVYASDGTNPQYDNTNPFVCINDLYTDDLRKKYLEYEWNKSDNLVISTGSSMTDPEISIRPKSKFEDGNSANYVTVKISLKDKQALDDEINQLNIDKGIAEQKKVDLEKIKQYITQNWLDIFQNFNYNTIIGVLNNSKNFLKYREKCLESIDNAGNALNNFNNYYKSKYNRDYNSYNIFSSLLIIDYARIYELNENYFDNTLDLVNGGETYPSCIINDNFESSSLSAGEKAQLKSLAQTYNDILTTQYNTNRNNLIQKDINGNYILLNEYNNYVNIANDCLGLTSRLQLDDLIIIENLPEIISELKKLKTELDSYSDRLNNYSSKISSYASFVEDVLKPMLSSLEIYTNTTYQENFYNEKINEIDEILIEIENSLKELNELLLLVPENITVTHIKPVILLYNKYEMSNINGWDGNKLYLDSNNGSYLLAPQIGAGTKGSGNTFTGIVMGVRQTGTTKDVGLFGYGSGVQTLFFDAKTGNSTFGSTGKGQIQITPTSGVITGGSFVRRAGTGSGMQINLAAPSIEWGNQKFIVDSNGNLTTQNITANVSGNIGGWTINSSSYPNMLVSSGGSLKLSGANSAIYSGSHSNLNATSVGFFISPDGLSIGSNFKVTSDGTLTAKNGSFTGTITTGNGYIGGWKINPDSISAGRTILSKDGTVTCEALYATLGGNIGGWNISGQGLTNGSLSLGSSITGPGFSLDGVHGLSFSGGGGVSFSPRAFSIPTSTSVGGYDIGTFCAKQITAERINAAIIHADMTTSGTISCGAINVTSSAGSSFNGNVGVGSISCGGHKWAGGINSGGKVLKSASLSVKYKDGYVSSVSLGTDYINLVNLLVADS